MGNRDGLQATDEVCRGMRGEELSERLAHRQATRDGKVADGKRVLERQGEEGLADNRAIRDDPTAASGPTNPRAEFFRAHPMGPKVRRQITFQPRGDEGLELSGMGTIGEHEGLAASLAPAGWVEEAKDVHLGFQGGGGFGRGTGRKDDQAARVTLREADGFIEPRGSVRRGDVRPEHQDDVHLRSARGVFAFLRPCLVERRQGRRDLHRETRERVEDGMRHGT